MDEAGEPSVMTRSESDPSSIIPQPSSVPVWDVAALRRKYGPFFWGSATLDRWVNQTGWPLTELIVGFAKGLAAGSRVLDAGAGPATVRDAFAHGVYEACDVGGYGAVEGMYNSDPASAFFACDLTAIPRGDGTYDGVICSSVLEHVPDPRAVLAELARVLAPTGVLCLSTSGLYGLHMEPWHFYNTTPYSLLHLSAAAGLGVQWLAPRGGFFNMVGGTLPKVVDANLRAAKKKWLRPLLAPLTHVLIPAACAAVDRFDRLKQFAVGWDLIATRRGATAVEFDDTHLPARMRLPRYQPARLLERYPDFAKLVESAAAPGHA